VSSGVPHKKDCAVAFKPSNIKTEAQQLPFKYLNISVLSD